MVDALTLAALQAWTDANGHGRLLTRVRITLGELRKIVHDVVEDAEPQFDIEQFRKITTRGRALAYLRTHAEYAGEGRGRFVYDTRHGYVIKLAKSPHGMRQNTTEVSALRCAKDIAPSFYVTSSPPGLWVAVEKVRPVNYDVINKNVKELTGLDDLQDLETALWTGETECDEDDIANGFRDRHDELMKRSAWYRKLFDVYSRCKVTDLNIYNWGVTDGGRFVLTDLGL